VAVSSTEKAVTDAERKIAAKKIVFKIDVGREVPVL
jgi:hypothetical protein